MKNYTETIEIPMTLGVPANIWKENCTDYLGWVVPVKFNGTRIGEVRQEQGKPITLHVVRSKGDENYLDAIECPNMAEAMNILTNSRWKIIWETGLSKDEISQVCLLEMPEYRVLGGMKREVRHEQHA